ncbi:MAG TPA: TetR/AcrR family transcriptional regulator [Acidimicrobiales bacterium]|nr:TetR/AcrR family transcriptional regulator [Acidimicrobiales bacterium]
MVSRKPIAQEVESVETEDRLPEWKQQSIDRSLQAARSRATERSDRFVASAIAIMDQRGGLDFTVQDVVDHSRMSIRTFYKFFASKDDLLVAVHQTILASELVPRLRKYCDAETDPVRRLKAYIQGMYDLTSRPGDSVQRALTTFRNRLAETRPEDLYRAYRPHFELVAELVQDAAAAGELKTNLPPDILAYLFYQAVLAVVHARILSPYDIDVTPDQLWLFCSEGIGAVPASTKSTPKRSSPKRSTTRSR